MNFLIRLAGLLVALFGSIIIRHFLGVSVIGTAWQVDLVFMSLTLDPFTSVYVVFAFIYEVGYWTSVIVEKKKLA
jgi:hypothetical protein